MLIGASIWRRSPSEIASEHCERPEMGGLGYVAAGVRLALFDLETREFGVAHLIATEPEQANGEFTGRVCGLPCFRDGKVARLESWLAGRGLRWRDVTQSWFYSDSLNDLFLLQKVNHPVAVDPDSTLRAHAEQQGWPIISLR